MDWWSRLVGSAWWLLDTHGQLAAFLFLLIEEAGTPIPIPGDFVMVLAGVRAAEGRLNLLEILLVMEAATVLGASILYWLSARAGRRVVYRLGRYVGLTPARLDRAAEALQHRGAAAVFLGRLTPGLRIATPIAAGVFGFPFRVYLPAMALGAFVYLLVFTLLGFTLGPRVLGWLEAIELPIGLLISTALLVVLVVWTERVARHRVPERCPELRERAWAGAVAGAIATFESALLVNVLVHLLGLVAFHAPASVLAELVRLASVSFGRAPGLSAVLVLLPGFFLVGSLLGLAYGVWLGNAAYGAGLRHGLAYALLPLAGSLLLAMPLAGAGPAGLGLGAGILPALGETVRHLAFGLVLGALYPALARPPRTSALPSAPDGSTAGSAASSTVATQAPPT